MCLRAIALLAALAVMVSGCDDGGGGPAGLTDHGPGPRPERFSRYAGERGLGPEAVVRAYVEAIDRRDGERFCGLIAPYTAGAYDIASRDPDSGIRAQGCPDFVRGFIGFTTDCCPPQFQSARVKSVSEARVERGLMRVDAQVYVRIEQEGKRRTETLKDTVWLARFDGAWRVAKPSRVALAASLIHPNRPREDPAPPPDVEAEMKRYTAELRDFERRLRERASSYAPPGAPERCRGGVTIADRAGDVVDFQHPAPRTPPPPTPRVDIRSVTIASDGRRICLEWRAAGPIEGHLEARFNMGAADPGPSGFSQPFAVELRPDGKARVTSGEDEDHRPVPVPARVGAGGDRLTLVLDGESFRRGRQSPMSSGRPPLRRFGFNTSLTARLSEQRMLHDDLGPLPQPQLWLYPDGRQDR